MLYHMPHLTRINNKRNDTPHKIFLLCNLLLWRNGPPLRKIGLVGETCLSPTRFIGEVKLSAIFSLEENNLPLGEVKLSLVNFNLYLRKMGPPFGNIGLSGETCLSTTFSLRELTFPADLSFKGVNFPL